MIFEKARRYFENSNKNNFGSRRHVGTSPHVGLIFDGDREDSLELQMHFWWRLDDFLKTSDFLKKRTRNILAETGS